MEHHRPRKPPLMIKVLVFELDGKQIREYLVNFRHDSKRKWVTQLMVWAVMNHKSIEILAAEDD